MKKMTYWLSLILISTIAWETVIESALLGSISRVIGLATAAFWCMTVLLAGRLRPPSVLHSLMFIFVLWNAASVFWSNDTDQSLGRLSTWVQLFLMVYIFWDVYTTRAQFLSALQMYVVGAYIAFLSTIGNFLSGTTFYFERFSAAGTNPDDLGAVLALGIPVAWYLARLPSTAEKAPLPAWVNLLYIPVAFGGIALSSTRTALIASIPAVLFILLSLLRARIVTQVLVTVFFVLSSLILLQSIPQTSLDRLGTTGAELRGGDLNGRLELWQQGLAVFPDHALLGIGSNRYRSITIEGKVAHNSFISVLVELGLIGFTLFMLMIGALVFQLLRLPRWERFFWLTMVCCWLLVAFTLTWEHRKPTWFVFGLAAVATSLRRQSELDRANRVPEWLATSLAR